MEWLSNVGNIVLVALGIGGVIFIHECGHFFAARWCGVRVETFSLGFGPKLLGFQRGGTQYQLAALPLGGYVRMAGEDGGTPGARGSDELPSKSVGQRFFIYSGGVIANVLLGLVVFPILFAHGVPLDAPILGAPTPGGPAWQAGIGAGATIQRVNGKPVASFSHVATEIALGDPERAELELVDAAGVQHAYTLVPRYDESLGIYSIGISPGEDREGRILVEPGSAAAEAGLANGDRLISLEHGVPGLPLSEQLGIAFAEGGPVRGRFAREERVFDAEIRPRTRDGKKEILGVAPLEALVVDVRASALTQRLGLAKDDRLLRVAGREILRHGDFVRALVGAGTTLAFDVERAGAPLALALDGVDDAAKLELVNSIALGADVGSTRVVVTPGSSAARAGITDGDRILGIAGQSVAAFTEVRKTIDGQPKGAPFALELERAQADGSRTRVQLSAAVGPYQEFLPGFGIQRAEHVYRVAGFLPALEEGWRASWRFLQEGWLMLKRIMNRQISSEHVGGIITISVVSHHFAESGIVALLFFLCTLSMNLAFLNVLPIPVLDGGHLFFLVVEKLKGSPVSERVMGYSQMVGIVLILSLMVYVTYNDVMRWIF